MKPYKTALEKTWPDGKPSLFYSYDSRGRLLEHRRDLYGVSSYYAKYERFGEDIERRER
jgi:hypothetical protein